MISIDAPTVTGIAVYRHLGFVPTDAEQTVDGLRFFADEVSRKFLTRK